MTNAKVYQGFRDDKKVEEHWYAWRLCALGTGQNICINQSGSETKQKLGFPNAPCRATVQHFYEQILPIHIGGILPIRYIGNTVISADTSV